MTSLGRLIFLDQPGTGASDPVTLGALPTLEQWGDITAVLDDLGSREAVLLASAGAFATGALSRPAVARVMAWMAEKRTAVNNDPRIVPGILGVAG